MREVKRKNILPTPTFYERAVAKLAPGYASRLYKTRTALLMAESYVGASRSRRSMTGWSVSDGDADTDILPYIENLRERSRDLVRNNSVAGAAINTKVTSVVGTGLTLQSRIGRDILNITDEHASEWETKTEAEWRLWANSCDFERVLDFEGLQELVFRSVLENGDTLVLSPYKKFQGDAYGLKIQLVEADRICNKGNAEDTNDLAGGVEKIGGSPTKYHVLNGHPGERWSGTCSWTIYDAFAADGRRNAWLLFHKIRIGQTRGVPDLAPVIEDIKQLGRYKEAELMATVVSALFTVFVKTESGLGGDFSDLKDEVGASALDKDIKLGSGMIVDLAEGEDIVTANPGRPNPAFDAFVSAATREIGARLELPYEVLTKHFSSSYSAARAALLEAWRYFQNRRKWLADSFCRPVYELFLTEAVAEGRIVAPGFLSGDPLLRQAWLGSDWIGDAQGHIDEGKAAAAANKRIEYGLSNESIETTSLTGRDRDEVYRQRKKEIEQRKADGMMKTDIDGSKQQQVIE